MSKLLLGLLVSGIILLIMGDVGMILWACNDLAQEWQLTCGY